MVEHLSDVYSENNSDCCGEKLTHYDKNWDDGICSKCGEHSPAYREEKDCDVEAKTIGVE